MSPNIREGKKKVQKYCQHQEPWGKVDKAACTQKEFPDKIETFQQAAVTHICQASCSHVRLRVKNEEQGRKLHLQNAFIE